KPTPPSVAPNSGPTAVILMESDGGASGDPWTDPMTADDLDAPTVATTGSVPGLPSPGIRSAIVARPPLPSMHPDGESTLPIERDKRASSQGKHQTTMKLDSLPPAPPRRPATSSYAPPPAFVPSQPAPQNAWMPPRFDAPPPVQTPGPAPMMIAAVAIGATVLVVLLIGAYFLIRAL
ncbi:MAG: hypothetical protein JWP87_3328, partial [Labilithrix sp.]|nr:hypothetical protein [Labilithrix sp.]